MAGIRKVRVPREGKIGIINECLQIMMDQIL